MSIRTILVSLSGGAGSEGAIETACRLATKFGAHLTALHVSADPRDVPPMPQDMGGPVALELVALAEREAREHAAKARAVFDAALARHGLPLRDEPPGRTRSAGGASAAWRGETGHAPAIVPRRARLADLVVLGQSGRVTDQPSSTTVEETVIGGGRPVLLAPARAAAPLGEIIAIAWNASPQAARAVAGALPFLTRARAVHVLSTRSGEAAPEELVGYLAWQGVDAATTIVETVDGVGTGGVLLAAARDKGADLLVMGGWGH
ncbi:MAG: universal stress protein, partial [Alphaproteobacteria bacterium]|nr:universal stress protein [Alphaproteobacteria bacterium]